MKLCYSKFTHNTHRERARIKKFVEIRIYKKKCVCFFLLFYFSMLCVFLRSFVFGFECSLALLGINYTQYVCCCFLLLLLFSCRCFLSCFWRSACLSVYVYLLYCLYILFFTFLLLSLIFCQFFASNFFFRSPLLHSSVRHTKKDEDWRRFS